jgi:hypothetical protein
MIGIRSSGSFDNTLKFLKRNQTLQPYDNLSTLCEMGVRQLSSATPVDTGKTAESWDYTIDRQPNRIQINWTNSNVQNGVPIAVIIQLGHGTGTGGWVEGRDYINPAMSKVFDEISQAVWKEMTE